MNMKHKADLRSLDNVDKVLPDKDFYIHSL